MVKHNNQLPKNHFVRILLVHTEGINADNIAQGLAEASQDLGKSNLDYVSRCIGESEWNIGWMDSTGYEGYRRTRENTTNN